MEVEKHTCSQCGNIDCIPTNNQVYWANITHNLAGMAHAAGIRNALWCPDRDGIKKASELIKPLTDGLKRLKEDPERFEKFNSPNGWGLYRHLVPFVEKYLNGCRSVCRDYCWYFHCPL